MKLKPFFAGAIALIGVFGFWRFTNNSSNVPINVSTISEIVLAACVDNADNIVDAADFFESATNVTSTASIPRYHPIEKAFYIHGAFHSLNSGAEGKVSWLLLAPTKDGALSYCQVSVQNPANAEEQLVEMVEKLELKPAINSGEVRKLTETELALGIDTRLGEKYWISAKFPKASIKTDISLPNKPSEQSLNNTGTELLNNRPTSKGSVHFIADLRN